MPLPLPYTQLALGSAVLLLLAALMFGAYRWGRSAERAKGLKRVLEAEREMKGAVDRARESPVRVDADWLKGTRARTPPAKPKDRG